jgi:excisionase family DNA binding protein
MDSTMILTPVSLTTIMDGLREIVRDELKQQGRADLAEKLLTPKEAADLLRVSMVTIWQWEKQGRITKHSMGGRTYFKYSELLAGLDTLQRYRKTGTRGAAAAS